ncbi:MAG: glycosyltransferase family 2 protein [Planctomycetaceae bacterium]|nr:glycosyltransferase family 2 protein [Planctomycetaceae bacterium]
MTLTGNDDGRPTLTVIIPVYNEASTLEECVLRVLRVPYDKQILVVDDGSSDRTPEILELLEATQPIQVLRHLDNRGKGAAIRTALPYASGRFTIIQDGDLELSPADYPRLVEPLLAGEADCMIGSRFAAARSRSLSRAGVACLNLCVKLLFGIRLTDEACCYKVFPTASLQAMDLECSGFEFCPEAIAKACRLGMRIREAPVSYQPRGVADGKKLRYRDGIVAVATLWKWRRWSPDRMQFELLRRLKLDTQLGDNSTDDESSDLQIAGIDV